MPLVAALPHGSEAAQQGDANPAIEALRVRIRTQSKAVAGDWATPAPMGRCTGFPWWCCTRNVSIQSWCCRWQMRSAIEAQLVDGRR
jgi:hypothetical protein